MTIINAFLFELSSVIVILYSQQIFLPVLFFLIGTQQLCFSSCHRDSTKTHCSTALQLISDTVIQILVHTKNEERIPVCPFPISYLPCSQYFINPRNSNGRSKISYSKNNMWQPTGAQCPSFCSKFCCYNEKHQEPNGSFKFWISSFRFRP